MNKPIRSVDWVDNRLVIVDQTQLPEQLVMKNIGTVPELVTAIKSLEVRGAPSIGVAAAFGVVLGVMQYNYDQTLLPMMEFLKNSRPTAVNLAKCVDRMLEVTPRTFPVILDEALTIRDEEIRACYAMGRKGADLLYSVFSRTPLRLMTICNTGGLAAVERGTALGVIQTVLEDGYLKEVFVMETRPLLQGARLTTWELERMGAEFHLHVDSAGPALISKGVVDAVLVGADRITSDHYVANKIGTYSLALAAMRQKIPFLVVAPTSTFDPLSKGSDIVIEDRSGDEVTDMGWWGTVNPAFDVTPPDLITAIISDKGVIFP